MTGDVWVGILRVRKGTPLQLLQDAISAYAAHLTYPISSADEWDRAKKAVEGHDPS